MNIKKYTLLYVAFFFQLIPLFAGKFSSSDQRNGSNGSDLTKVPIAENLQFLDSFNEDEEIMMCPCNLLDLVNKGEKGCTIIEGLLFTVSAILTLVLTILGYAKRKKAREGVSKAYGSIRERFSMRERSTSNREGEA